MNIRKCDSFVMIIVDNSMAIIGKISFSWMMMKLSDIWELVFKNGPSKICGR